MIVQFTLNLSVHDEKAFRQAAHDRALADGLPEETAAEFLNDEQPLTQCTIMLLDPGVSPAGTQINWSAAD